MAIFQDNLGKLLPECLHSGFYWRMMEVVVTTGAVRHAKLQSNSHHQHANTQLYRPHALPVAQPTVLEPWRENALYIKKQIINFTKKGTFYPAFFVFLSLC